MPGGNGTPAPLEWQPVPGAPGAAIYPLIRKTDTISSNSYLIATPDAIILIDPGGLAEQADRLAQVTGECRKIKDRPVFIILTHAHIDHFAGILTTPAFAYPEAAVLAVQERGAESLEQGDTKLTQAGLMGRSLPPLRAGLHLFPRGWEADSGIPVQQAFANGATVTVTHKRPGEGGTLPTARLEFGNGPAPEVFFSPGHSPDSICIRIGELLFIGDLLFAANPGVAGLCGWDREALIRSLDGILAVIAAGGISTVCPGHGHLVAGRDAEKILAGVRTGAGALAGIAELNCRRAEETAAYAGDCMEQVNELFTIMAGRLSYVSYVMEELGETDLAGRMKTLIPADMVDGLLEAFTAFAEAHQGKENVSIHLALKAGQVIGKLERSIKKEELSRIIDPTLVSRAERLLSDYTTMLRGFSPPAERLEWPVVPLIEAVSTGCSVPSCSDEEILSSSDDEEVFLRFLLARIGARPLLEEVTFALEAPDKALCAVFDRDHISDLVTYILEDLVGTGSRQVTIQAGQDRQGVIINIAGNVNYGTAAGPKKTRRFLSGLAVRAGGTLAYQEDAGMRRFLIRLGPANSGA